MQEGIWVSYESRNFNVYEHKHSTHYLELLVRVPQKAIMRNGQEITFLVSESGTFHVQKITF